MTSRAIYRAINRGNHSLGHISTLLFPSTPPLYCITSKTLYSYIIYLFIIYYYLLYHSLLYRYQFSTLTYSALLYPTLPYTTLLYLLYTTLIYFFHCNLSYVRPWSNVNRSLSTIPHLRFEQAQPKSWACLTPNQTNIKIKIALIDRWQIDCRW